MVQVVTRLLAGPPAPPSRINVYRSDTPLWIVSVTRLYIVPDDRVARSLLDVEVVTVDSEAVDGGTDVNRSNHDGVAWVRRAAAVYLDRPTCTS